jgi:tail tube protein
MTTSPTFIPGYLGTLTVNSEDVSAIVANATLTLTRNALSKPTLGQPWGYALSGQRSGTISYSGHLSAEQAAALNEIFMEDAPVDFSFQIGEGGGATDAGTYTGQCVITSLAHEVDAEGEWDWTLEATTSGPVVYTPVVVP